MTRRPGTARRGITLTEILISILIMGIGLISLATLFPLGMVRLREANRQHRSALLGESATADLAALGLLYKPSFFLSWYGPAFSAYGSAYDPFTQDPLSATSILTAPLTLNNGTTYSFSALPVCYDPLWWYMVGPNDPNNPGVTAGSNVAPSTVAANGEFRFGQGVFLYPGGNSFVRLNVPLDNGTPSAHGLQRVTNFNPLLANATFTDPTTTFVSPDDYVMQNSDAAPQILGSGNAATDTGLSGVVPIMSGLYPLNDWRYTWLFTGSQVDVTNATVFVGNVVVMDSRPLAVDSVTSPTSGTASPVASGETVLEAIFGYSGTITAVPGYAFGYGVAADRTVLLRWPSAMPDPEIKVGSWIADVTYQRDPSRIQALSASLPNGHPLQRCNWYQIAKRGEAQADPDVPGYRRMVVTVNTPVKDRTLLNSGGTPVIVNVALFMPSVVNVFQRTVFVRTDR